MTRFLHTINYSSSNEDARSECRALRLGPTDTVLCVTGSGARPLDLLTQCPARIVTVDINPCQHHLLRLKMAAIRRLDYETFMAFIGGAESGDRMAIYETIRADLSPAAREFWDENRSLVRFGILYAGRWERHFRKLARFLGMVRPDLRRELFNSATLEEQITVWTRWRGGIWPLFLRLLTDRGVWRYLLRDPGFYQFVPVGFSIPAYIREAFDTAAREVLFRSSPFANLLFFGHYSSGGPLPIHLQREQFSVIRDGLSKLHIVEGALANVLDWSDEQFTAFSLSDFSSYCDEATYHETWRRIIRASAPGARVCERQFLVKRQLDDETARALQRDVSLETALAREDRSLFYSFIAGRTAD